MIGDSWSWKQKVLFFALPLFVLGIGTCAGSVLMVGAVVNAPDPFEAREFDPAIWATAEPEQRAKMVRDAIRHLPVGLPEAEVHALLGKGEVLDTHKLASRSATFDTVRTHSYYLGRWPGDYCASTYLWVHVSASGRVTGTEIGGNDCGVWGD